MSILAIYLGVGVFVGFLRFLWCREKAKKWLQSYDRAFEEYLKDPSKEDEVRLVLAAKGQKVHDFSLNEFFLVACFWLPISIVFVPLFSILLVQMGYERLCELFDESFDLERQIKNRSFQLADKNRIFSLTHPDEEIRKLAEGSLDPKDFEFFKHNREFRDRYNQIQQKLQKLQNSPKKFIGAKIK